MAISFKQYKPFASAVTITFRSGVGGTSKTTKLKVNEQAPLARLSAPLLASLNTCLIITVYWNCCSKYLQSLRSDVYELLGVFLERIGSTTTLASNSTAKCVIPSCEASVRPSLRAQNSAIMLVLIPKYLIYPLIHLPQESRMSPSPPAFPRLPKEAPSELSLNHPSCAYSNKPE